MRHAIRRLALAGTVVAVALIAGEAAAGPGASIAPGRLVADAPIGQGTEVRFPPILVGNTGDEPVEMFMDVTHIQDQPEAVPEPRWFRLDPPRFTLGPSEDRLVDVVLRVPKDAAPGGYRTLVRATQAPAADAPGGAVGASVALAVATVLSFDIEERVVDWYDPLMTQGQRLLPLWLFLTGVVLWLGLGRLRRRLPWEIAVRPRSRE